MSTLLVQFSFVIFYEVDTILKRLVIYRSVCVLPELSIGFFLLII